MSDGSFDTPDTVEVYQQDEPEDSIVPVKIENVVRTDELPTHTYFKNYIWPGSGNAEKILNADQRRKRLIIWVNLQTASGQGLCIATTQGQAQTFGGAILTSVNASTRYEFTGTDEIWARGVSFAIPWQGFSVETDDIVVSMAVEQWSR